VSITSRVGSGTFVSELAARLRDAGEAEDRSALRPRRVWNSIPLSTAFARPAAFDFRGGLPDVSFFPHQAWRRLMTRELRSDAAAAGGMPARGAPGFAQAIARTSRFAGVACWLMTSSSQRHAAGDRRRGAFVGGAGIESPSRIGYSYRDGCSSRSARCRWLPVDNDGLVVDALPRGTRLVYVTPHISIHSACRCRGPAGRAAGVGREA
jgi:GntR family transcriptional regulator/MocR family aminotransferase